MSEDAVEESPEPTPSKGRKWVKILLAVLMVMTLGCIGLCCGGPYAVGFGMNAGEVKLTDIGSDWMVERGDATERPRKPTKAAPIKKALETQCWPMKNGVRVLFNHLWYNAITDGYDGRIWMDAPKGQYDSYGMYIWGDKVFLRDEASAGGYVNRVLVCELEYADWQKLAGEK